MTAAPNSPLVEIVARTLAAEDYRQKRRGDYNDADPYASRHWGEYQPEAKTALAACEAEAMMKALKAAHSHVLELRDAWERGDISEHDGRGGTRSNRNVDVEVELRHLLARLEPEP